MSLKFKIAFLVAGLMFTAIGSFTVILVLNEEAALRRSLKDKQMDLVRGFAAVCKESSITQQDILLSNYLRTFKNTPGIIAALFIDPAGKVLGHTDVSKLYTTLSDSRTLEILKTSDIMRTAYQNGAEGIVEADAPVIHGTRRLGTARILLSEAFLEQNLRQDIAQARSRILRLSFPILLLGFFGAFLVTAVVMRPVQTLTEGARAIGSGKLNHIIPIRTADELGQLAQEFNKMAVKLRELDEMKQDFVSSVTHDLKSPLSTVRTATELLLLETEKAEKQQANVSKMADCLFIIQDSIDNLTSLINSMLEVAKIESGLRLDEKETNLEDIAHRVIRSFQLIARQKGIELRLIVDQAISEIHADGAKLERVVSNLVSNAIKFTSRGEVVLKIAQSEAFQELRVSDTGRGIPPDHLDKLFTKFYRVPEKGKFTKGVEGTGLGLVIAKGIIEAHGGQVGVESEAGRGTTFIVKLPRTRKTS